MSTAGNKEKIQKAGGFHVQQLEIITSKGVVVDLLGALVHITFFEDIQASSITGNCILNDLVNLSLESQSISIGGGLPIAISALVSKAIIAVRSLSA